MTTPTLDDARQPLPAGTRLREGSVAAVVGVGLLGPVYRVLARPGLSLAPRLLAVREFLPLALAQRRGGAVHPRPGFEDAFEAAREAFDSEARRLAALDSSSFVRPVAVWQENGTSYRAGVWLEDPTLGQVVDHAVGLIPQEMLEIWMRALADALTPLHRGRSVHGHIEPRRVRLPANGRPQLPSPGLCRRLVAQALPGDLLATSPYTAPEQLKGARALPLGPWTDIYALAGLLHHAITGRHPPLAGERLGADRLEPLTRLAGREYAHHFLRGVDRGLTLSPELRPRSLAQFLGAMGIRERRRQARGSGTSALLTNLPVAYAEEIDIDVSAFGSLAG